MHRRTKGVSAHSNGCYRTMFMCKVRCAVYRVPSCVCKQPGCARGHNPTRPDPTRAPWVPKLVYLQPVLLALLELSIIQVALVLMNVPRIRSLPSPWTLLLVLNISYVSHESESQASLAASALIVELHLRLGPKLKPKAAKIGAGFVDTCLHHLRAYTSRMKALLASLDRTGSGGGGRGVEAGGGGARAAGSRSGTRSGSRDVL